MYICNTYNFGHRHRFGITFELHQEPELYCGRDLRGSVCFWVFAECIGDMAYGVPLSSDCWIELGKVVKNTASHCCNEVIFHANAELILQVLETDIENEADDIIKENCFGFVGTFDFWFGFKVTLELDIMSEYLILHFEHGDQARLIIAKLDENKEHYEFQREHMLGVGEMKAVFQEAFDWLNERYEQEVSREAQIAQQCPCPPVHLSNDCSQP